MESYIIANCTDTGKTRKINEDSMVTFDSPNGRVVAVCDGMGGQAAGDVASKLACAIIQDILENNTFANPHEAITKAIISANVGLLHKASQDPSLAGMGATCVMVIIKDGMVYYGWVGDSRIYYIANNRIRQISKDQSYVQMLVDNGSITQEEAEHHPQKNEITNALGFAGMTPPQIGEPLRPEDGSYILLCSDGLSGMVSKERIEKVVSDKEMKLSEKAKRLVADANENGGLDNITVQLIEFTGKREEKAIARPKQGFQFNSPLGYGIAGALCLAIIGFFIWLFVDASKPSIPDNQQNMPNPAQQMKTAPTQSTQQPSSGTQQSKPRVTNEPAKKNNTVQQTPVNKTNNNTKVNPKQVQNQNGQGDKGKVEKVLNQEKKQDPLQKQPEQPKSPTVTQKEIEDKI